MALSCTNAETRAHRVPTAVLTLPPAAPVSHSSNSQMATAIAASCSSALSFAPLMTSRLKPSENSDLHELSKSWYASKGISTARLFSKRWPHTRIALWRTTMSSLLKNPNKLCAMRSIMGESLLCQPKMTLPCSPSACTNVLNRSGACCRCDKRCSRTLFVVL